MAGQELRHVDDVFIDDMVGGGVVGDSDEEEGDADDN